MVHTSPVVTSAVLSVATPAMLPPMDARAAATATQNLRLFNLYISSLLTFVFLRL